MTKLYSLIIVLTGLMGISTLAHAQTLYNSQGGGGGSYYNGGSAPLNLKAITQGKDTAAGSSYRSVSRQTRDAFTSSAYTDQATALQAYRTQRDQQAQSAYASEIANITRLSENVGTPQFNATNTAGQNTLYGNNMAGNGYGVPVRQVYRGADKNNLNPPKKVFNSNY